jgi:hypothetical protein
MTNTKKKVYQKKPYININIKNENNQQSKNKYVKPPPEEIQNASAYPNINNNVSSQVPLAYEPYNPLASKLWNNPEDAQQLEARGFRNAVRPPPQYEGPNADVPEGNVLGGREEVNRLVDEGFIEDDGASSMSIPYSFLREDDEASSIYPPLSSRHTNIREDDEVSSIYAPLSSRHTNIREDDEASSIYPPLSILREIQQNKQSEDEGASILTSSTILREIEQNKQRERNKINDLGKSFPDPVYDLYEDEEDFEEIPLAVVKKRRPRLTGEEKETAKAIEGRELSYKENKSWSITFRTGFKEKYKREYEGTPEDKNDMIDYLTDTYRQYFNKK